MAGIISLGIHTPSALPYLVGEGILAQDAGTDEYVWHTYDDRQAEVEEEVFRTKTTVVYSRDGYVHSVHHFDKEDQKVNFAVLTRFANFQKVGSSTTGHGPESVANQPNVRPRTARRPHRTSGFGTKAFPGTRTEQLNQDAGPESAREDHSRALVICLDREVQIHFLSGPSYVVHLPFELQQVYPSPEGIIVQRKTGSGSALPQSPAVPIAPPNSFHYPNSQSLVVSRSTQAGSKFAQSQNGQRPSHKAGGVPDVLFESFFAPFKDGDETTPSLYSLTDPLSNFCALAQGTLATSARRNRNVPQDLLVEYDDLDSAERVVYMSSDDEIQDDAALSTVPLLLIVTANHELGQITIWQGWYLQTQSLSSLMSLRAALKANRAQRRRSSHGVATTTNGTTTPIVRHRDRTRESFAATAQVSVENKDKRRKSARQKAKLSADDEEALASQLDPDFKASQGSVRGTRRVSSLLSRGDLSTTDPIRGHIGGNGNIGRRGTSFSTTHDRRSFGTSIYRKSRGSTPGSIFSQSVGDQDTMELDLNSTDLLDEEIDQVQQLYLATQTATGIESALGCMDEGIKQELVLRKVHVLPLGPSKKEKNLDRTVAETLKVHTLLNDNHHDQTRQVLSLFVLDKEKAQLTTLDFSVAKSVTILPQAVGSTSAVNVPVPLLQQSRSSTECCDLVKVRQGKLHAIVTSYVDRRLEIVPSSGSMWSVDLPSKVRVFDPTNTRSVLNQNHRDVGKRRLTDILPDDMPQLAAAPTGQIDIAGSDGQRHRIKLLLEPRNANVVQALNVLKFALGKDKGGQILRLWTSAYSFLTSQSLCSPSVDISEWQALIVTMFSLAVGSLASTNQSKLTTTPRKRQRKQDLTQDTGKQAMEAAPFNSAWGWLQAARRPKATTSTTRGHGKAPSEGAYYDEPFESSMTEWQARARHLVQQVATDELKWLIEPESNAERWSCSAKAMVAIHLLREEWKLSILCDKSKQQASAFLAAGEAQMGHWLQLEHWDSKTGAFSQTEASSLSWDFSDAAMTKGSSSDSGLNNGSVPSIFQAVERAMNGDDELPYPGLDQVADLGATFTDPALSSANAEVLLPRSSALRKFLSRWSSVRPGPETVIEEMHRHGLGGTVLETLPEAIAAPFREAIAECQANPPPTWNANLLRLVGREDLVTVAKSKPRASYATARMAASTDVQAVFSLAERMPLLSKTHEAKRHAIIQQIFPEDRRYMEAARLTNPSAQQVAECPSQPEWSEGEYLEQQRRVMQWVMVRVMALPSGNAMVHFESQRPLLSEKFHVPGFNLNCVMKPTNNTIAAEKTGFTEEKLSWAFFHAGVSAGLHISRHATGIDTSWIVFNKPTESTNRHAGFLLALGLNNHLRNLAKWLAFKYLTPKHTMTSVGLLLGLSASYLGTMDSLITRMLSVHISRMLPAGAAELNVSPLTQTAGLMGIGLLYFNTQHRRMSEIMLSEIEHRDSEAEGPAELIRDESYRLASGFALGLINLGKGHNLKGLHGMGLLERLLSVAIGPRPVESVHVVDKAVAGAVMAIAFVYMKTGDKSVAKKIDVPDTATQLDHVRPDILLLRSLAKNIIMWDDILDVPGWIRQNLPAACANRIFTANAAESDKAAKPLQLKSEDIATFNIIASLAWALSLKYAGSGNKIARDEVLEYLRLFTTLAKKDAFYYDAMLARTTVKRCIDLMALAAASIMAGTGDIETFRYLRRLHGRTDASTTYGGGTYTFGTSDMATASLICAFYPLFPSDVLDNTVHLQALRHFWVFAAEPRCAVAQDIDAQRPVPIKLQVRLRNDQVLHLKSPCLLPELNTIATIQTDDPTYWPVVLDFVSNPDHLEAFRAKQTLRVRRAPAQITSPLLFSSTLTSLNEAQSIPPWRRVWEWFLMLPAFGDSDSSDLGLILPSVASSSLYADERGTVVDDRLALTRGTRSSASQDDLWNLRVLFSWAQEAQKHGDGRLKWLGKGTLDKLQTEIQRRMIEMTEAD
ncbi:hypothetical protein MBLNU457_g3013t1 [Dothideomycetes sp. NU457]